MHTPYKQHPTCVLHASSVDGCFTGPNSGGTKLGSVAEAPGGTDVIQISPDEKFTTQQESSIGHCQGEVCRGSAAALASLRPTGQVLACTLCRTTGPSSGALRETLLHDAVATPSVHTGYPSTLSHPHSHTHLLTLVPNTRPVHSLETHILVSNTLLFLNKIPFISLTMPRVCPSESTEAQPLCLSYVSPNCD